MHMATSIRSLYYVYERSGSRVKHTLHKHATQTRYTNTRYTNTRYTNTLHKHATQTRYTNTRYTNTLHKHTLHKHATQTYATQTHTTQRLSTSDTLPSIYVQRRINIWVVHTRLYNCRYFGYDRTHKQYSRRRIRSVTSANTLHPTNALILEPLRGIKNYHT